MSLAGTESYLGRFEWAIARNRNFAFTTLTLVSLAGMYFNFYLGSSILGVLVFVLYCLPNAVFVGRIFFKNDSLSFRLFYGFVSLITLLTLTGLVTYLIYDFSNFAVIIMLALVSLLLTFLLNRVGVGDLSSVVTNEATLQNMAKLGHFLKVRVALFLVLIFSSYLFLYVARTGESLGSPFDVVSPYFFVAYFFAILVLLDLVFRVSEKSLVIRSSANRQIFKLNEKHLILILTILLVSVPASVYLLVLKYPAEHGVSLNIAWAQLLDKFGRFVTDPSHVERQSFWLHKEFGDYTGHYVLVSLVSKFLQINVESVQLYITAIFFSICVPVTTYFTTIMVLPRKNNQAALLVSALVGFSQYTLFLLTPPNKPESYAMVLLLVTILFSIRYASGKSSFILPLGFSLATLMTHSYAGQYSLIVLVLAVYLKKTNFTYVTLNKKKIFGLAALIGVFLPSLIYVHEVGTLVKYFDAPLRPTLDVTQWVRLIFPKIWDDPTLAFPQQILYQYLNNFTYILYMVLAIGLVWSIKKKIDLKWIVLLSGLSSVALANTIVFKFFYPTQGYAGEWFRSFYSFSFISFPLAGLGIFWLTSKACNNPNGISRNFHSFRNKKTVKYALVLLVLASALTASFYGAFPRQGSMGPYNGGLRFPSDYDYQAVNFIIQDAASTNRTFLVLGDAWSTAAALQTIGYRVISTKFGGAVSSIYLFEWGLSLPNPQNSGSFDSLNIAVNSTKVDVTYLILSYRLGTNLQSIVNAYTSVYGPPLFESNKSVFVFKYIPYNETSPYIIVDGNQTMSGFWNVEGIGQGKIDVSTSDDNTIKVSQNDSLKIMVVNGTYQRFTLQHTYGEQQDLSKKDLFVMWVYGNNSEWNFNIVFRTFTINDYFTYQVTDNFEGWKRLIIPLTSFIDVGSPSWANVTEIMLQFQSIPKGTSLNIDRTLIDIRTP
jgi:hypothetical protein